jgi:hypothetical protein
MAAAPQARTRQPVQTAGGSRRSARAVLRPIPTSASAIISRPNTGRRKRPTRATAMRWRCWRSSKSATRSRPTIRRRKRWRKKRCRPAARREKSSSPGCWSTSRPGRRLSARHHPATGCRPGSGKRFGRRRPDAAGADLRQRRSSPEDDVKATNILKSSSSPAPAMPNTGPG